jgi:predicted porin
MKKSLLALAVLGAFAGAAQAQTNVTLYGIVDDSITHADQGSGAKSWSMYSGGNAASRIGVKGSEDLGGGTHASFLLENGFGSDDGSAGKVATTRGSAGQPKVIGAFSRLAYVGLGNNSIGTVRLGRQNTLQKEMFGSIDPFGAAGIANIHDFFLFGSMDQRQANLVSYFTPNIAGFHAEAQYGFGEQTGDFHADRQLGGLVGYKNGPLNVQFVYNTVNDKDTTATPVTDENTKDAILGATYDFNVVKLHAAYGDQRVTDVPTIGTQKNRSYMVGVTAPFGASAIRADYIRNQNRSVDNQDGAAMAVSYTYSMSKRTTLYATYVRSTSDDGTTTGLGDFAATNPGDSVNAISLGIEHKF